MNFSRYFSLLILLCAMFLVVPTVHSASVKERMAARIPEINALKDQGIVGENNMGYLEYRVAERPKQELIQAENADRQAVYQAIGKSQNAPADLVGQRRAKMIRESGIAGHWYQNPDGSWYKK